MVRMIRRIRREEEEGGRREWAQVGAQRASCEGVSVEADGEVWRWEWGQKEDSDAQRMRTQEDREKRLRS